MFTGKQTCQQSAAAISSSNRQHADEQTDQRKVACLLPSPELIFSSRGWFP
jgi:hypothetical protein